MHINRKVADLHSLLPIRRLRFVDDVEWWSRGSFIKDILRSSVFMEPFRGYLPPEYILEGSFVNEV